MSTSDMVLKIDIQLELWPEHLELYYPEQFFGPRWLKIPRKKE